MIKRLRELNAIAARHGFGPGRQTSSGRFVFEHEVTHAKVFVGFNQVNGGHGAKSLQIFEAELRRKLADHPPKKGFTSNPVGDKVDPTRNEERRKR